MTQVQVPRVVPTESLRDLLDWLERKHHPCSTYRHKKESLQTALNAVPELAPGWSDYHAAVKACMDHECHKMTSGCGYADQLHGKLRELKQALP